MPIISNFDYQICVDRSTICKLTIDSSFFCSIMFPNWGFTLDNCSFPLSWLTRSASLSSTSLWTPRNDRKNLSSEISIPSTVLYLSLWCGKIRDYAWWVLRRLQLKFRWLRGVSYGCFRIHLDYHLMEKVWPGQMNWFKGFGVLYAYLVFWCTICLYRDVALYVCVVYFEGRKERTCM